MGSFERLQPGVQHDGVLGEVDLGKPELPADVVHGLTGDERGDDDGTRLGDEGCGLVVDEVAVFDGVHAAVYGIRHPDHPGKLVLSSTQARLDPQRCAAVFERLGGELARETALDALARQADMASLAVYNEHCMPLYNPTPQPQAFAKAVFRQDLALKFHGLGGIWHRMDHLDAMDRITCPTLVLAGAQDPVTPIEDSEDMVARLGSSIVTYVPFENAGHGVWHDDPDRAAVLRDFIREAEAAP